MHIIEKHKRHYYHKRIINNDLSTKPLTNQDLDNLDKIEKNNRKLILKQLNIYQDILKIGQVYEKEFNKKQLYKLRQKINVSEKPIKTRKGIDNIEKAKYKTIDLFEQHIKHDIDDFDNIDVDIDLSIEENLDMLKKDIKSYLDD